MQPPKMQFQAIFQYKLYKVTIMYRNLFYHPDRQVDSDIIVEV